MNKNGKIQKKTVVELCLIFSVLILAIMTAVYLVKRRPQPKRRQKVYKAPAVSTMKVCRQDYKMTMNFQGRVRYLKEIDLKPRVAGFIVNASDNFIPGGIISKGDKLIEIDPADYENNLLKRVTEEKKAEKDYLHELGQQEIARIEWELANKNKDLSSLSDELVLRKPSLRFYKSQLDAAKSNTQIARRDLKDTIVIAPFKMAIKNIFVHEGSFVNSQTVIAKAVSADSYLIEASLPWDNLRFLNEKEQNPAIKALVKPLEGVDAQASWRAELKALSPSLEENGHLAKITLKITESDTNNEIPLLGGASVQVIFQDILLKNVFVVPADYVHEANQLWLKESGRLKIIEARRIWGDAENVVFADLPENALIIKDDLSRVWPGMALSDSSGEILAKKNDAEQVAKERGKVEAVVEKIN